MEKKQKLTTEAGAPVGDNQNIQTAGPHGPALLQNVWLIEKLAHFNRERIPERIVHAKGSGAFGTFTVTNDITRYTKASIFARVGKKTDVFMRFSTVAGERGAADTERDVRGFAMKFYTDEGNWDLVGNNTPVFFIRDPLKFPDFIHTQKRDPKTNLRSNTAMWDFWSLSPETLHQVMILMSDRGIPQDFRHMHGFGSHTFSFYNEYNERCWVKFHLRCMQGIANFTNEEAEKIVAKDREHSQRDLFESIEKGDFPKWKMCVQIMPEKDAETYRFNPFDLTKTLPSALAFLIDDHPDNQAAFDYGMCYLLVYKNLPAFMHYMPLYKERHQSFPKLYQEAICLYYASKGKMAEASNDYPIDSEVTNRMQQFLKTARSLSAANLKQLYGDTYYYYTEFMPTPKQ